jgi:cytochrome P450
VTDSNGSTGDAGERDLGGCPVIHLDPSPPREAGSYWQQADELREAGPAFFSTMGPGFWVFTRYDTVKEMYQHPETFSSESITPWEPDPAYRFVPTQIDPPEHIKYRQLLNPWFSPGAVDRADPMARAICRRLVAEVAPKGKCDFVTEFALRYPTEVFLTMLGLPGSDADLFVPWVEDFFAGFGGDVDKQGTMVDALASIRRYWEAALAERRPEPEPRPGDLASHLLHAEVDGAPLDETVTLDMLTVLVLAGLDTTRAQLGYLFRHLAARPDHRRRLIEEPNLVPSAVEEGLRLYTIIFGDGRKVTHDTIFHGCPLRKGDMVYGLVAGANRDPRRYGDADQFVIDRQGTHHFSFAGGPHRCLGAHLARREMHIAVSEWLRVIPDFALASDDPLMERGGGAMMTLLTLPLVWEV